MKLIKLIIFQTLLFVGMVFALEGVEMTTVEREVAFILAVIFCYGGISAMSIIYTIKKIGHDRNNKK